MASQRKNNAKNNANNPKAAAFLAAYQLTASITAAAGAAGIERTSHYRWLQSAAYRAAFKRARKEAADSLEDEAIRRAMEGVLEPVFYQGLKVGAVRRYSDSLMQFLLAGFKPKKYRARQKTELTGKDGEPLTGITVKFVGKDDGE